MGDIRHDVVSEIKRIAEELNKVPTRDEFRQHSQIATSVIDAAFGGYGKAIDAAYIKSKAPKQKKLTEKELFYKPIRELISNSRELIPPKSTTTNRILCVGDTHFPFTCMDTLTAIYGIAEKLNPTHIIQLGDLYDMYSHGKFPKSASYISPLEEITAGMKMAGDMWNSFKKIAPNAELISLRGNHDQRALKRVLECYPEGEIFFSIDKYFEFEGVTHVKDYREAYWIGDWMFHHGYLTTLGAHRDYNHANVCVGHTHRGGVSFKYMGSVNNIGGKILAELNCGYVGLPESKAMSYTAQKTTQWTKGVGVIDEWGPRFIPLD